MPALALERPAPPQILFGDLYADVELSGIFPDSKEFADATPKSPPDDILALYRAEKPLTPDGAQALRRRAFRLAGAVAVAERGRRARAAPPAHRRAVAGPDAGHADGPALFVASAAAAALRRSGRPVPRALLLGFVFHHAGPCRKRPGGPARGHGAEFRRAHRRLRPHSERDAVLLPHPLAAAVLLRHGRPARSGRSCGGLRALSAAAQDANMRSGWRARRAWRRAPRIAAWSSSTTARSSIAIGTTATRRATNPMPRTSPWRARLARPPQTTYRELRAAAESGWDFSSRWFADGRTLGTIDTTEIVPVDLNALLFGLENAIRAGCERSGDSDCAADFARRAAARRAAIDRTLWDAVARRLSRLSLDAEGAHRRASAPRRSIRCSRAPPSDAQAASVAAAVAKDLLEPGGIVATPVATGQQWDAPNGWAPLQWIAVSGLEERIGRDRLAEAIACRFMVNVERVYRQTGKLVEKYDVIATDRPGGGGEYPTQDGFGWTNGVMLKLMALYPADADLPSLDRCPAAGG